MYCGNCHAFLEPTDRVCPNCGTPLPVGMPQEVVIRENPGSVTLIHRTGRKVWGIILLLIAIAGCFYSMSDHAKIIGEWRQKDSYSYYSSSGQTDSYSCLKFLFNEYSERTSYSYDIERGTYSISNNVIIFTEEGGSPSKCPYMFVNNDELQLRGGLRTLTRAPGVRFYLFVLIASVVVGFIGFCVLVFSKTKVIYHQSPEMMEYGGDL